MSDAGWNGAADFQSFGSRFSANWFLVQQALAQIESATLVLVKGVTSDGALAIAGTVDVQPMVNQIDGNNNAVPHGIVYGLPYFRMQGGANAVIIDPEVGDIGLAIMANRDTSRVRATKAPANPGSRRRFDFSDGIYVGGLLNGIPTQFLRFSASGIELVSTTGIKLHAPTVTIEATNLNITADVAITGNLTVTGAIIAGSGGADQVGLQTHLHPANNTPPTPGT